ncbi:glycosyltransferase [Dermabacter hominis]|nr:glycosyltransferase [Dermabacter hominis]MCT2025143.1 glycosyltransferase [Dermabacter hominis]
MIVTAVTTWFPTRQSPTRGAFVVRDLHAIQKHADVRLIHLVPPHDDDGTRRLVHEGIEVLRIPFSPSHPHGWLRAIRVLNRALSRSDVVHSMAFSSLLALTPARIEIPWLHTEHWSALTTPDTLPGPIRAVLPILTQLLRFPDRVSAVCDFLARPIRDVRRDRPVDVVPCIVEPGNLIPRRSRQDGALRLVSTGGLIERKDPLIAVDTVAHLVGAGYDVTLEWLGDGPLKEATRARAVDLGVGERVVLAGSQPSHKVRERLGAADLFFGPTRADNFFVSAAEALIAGRPVVVGATGGQGEYIDPSVGALVPCQDPAAYASAILDVDARTRELSSEDIASVIGDRFSSERVGRAYAQLYEQLLASH